MEKTAEERKKEEQAIWVAKTIEEITALAEFIGTKDMHLAGIIYLVSIVRRRKSALFDKTE